LPYFFGNVGFGNKIMVLLLILLPAWVLLLLLLLLQELLLPPQRNVRMALLKMNVKFHGRRATLNRFLWWRRHLAR
jgi:hypothetical protein